MHHILKLNTEYSFVLTLNFSFIYFFFSSILSPEFIVYNIHSEAQRKSISTGCLRVNPPPTNLPQWKFHMCTESDLTSLRLHLETFSQRWMWWKAGWWTLTGIVRSQPGWKRKTVFPQRVFVGVWPPTLSRAALTPVYNNLVTVTRYCTVCA